MKLSVNPMAYAVIAAVVCSVAALAADADGCTAFIVGRKASATGHVIVGHNNDGFGPGQEAR